MKEFSPIYSHIHDQVQATPLQDTHEHLLRESTRLKGPGCHDLCPTTDASLLFYHYGKDDMTAARIPQPVQESFFCPDVQADKKWRLIEPYWKSVANTGYFLAGRRAARELFNVDEMSTDAFVTISEQMQEREPGFYHDILNSANITSVQVHSLETGVYINDPEYANGRFMQDISIRSLTHNLNIPLLEQHSCLRLAKLDDMEGLIDSYFKRFGEKAVAVKSNVAYERGLDFSRVTHHAADLAYKDLRNGSVSPVAKKTTEDYLTRYCLSKAQEYQLPVKLHTGYYVGNGRMDLEQMNQNAEDLAASGIFDDFSETQFVLMHMGYPNQHQFLALAKSYPNVNIDLCWSWIVNPVATQHFVEEYLTSAPANKLLVFGGDYINIEPIAGHASLARQGLTNALTHLIEDKYHSCEDVEEIIPQLMHQNAEKIFNLAKKGQFSTDE